jgi:hypothetical protein
MRKKIILFLLANILFTYLLDVSLGWLFYWICGGDPTYLIPLPTLLLLFYIVEVVIIRFALERFRMYSVSLMIVGSLEAAMLYIAFLAMFHQL